MLAHQKIVQIPKLLVPVDKIEIGIEQIVSHEVVDNRGKLTTQIEDPIGFLKNLCFHTPSEGEYHYSSHMLAVRLPLEGPQWVEGGRPAQCPEWVMGWTPPDGIDVPR